MDADAVSPLVECDKLWVEGARLSEESRKLREQIDRLKSEAEKLSERNELFGQAIIGVYGSIKLEWKDWAEGSECVHGK